MLLLLKTSSRKKSSKSSKPKKYGKGKGKGKTTKLYTKNLSSISESTLYKLLSKKKKGKGKTKRKYQNRQKHKQYFQQQPAFAPAVFRPTAFAAPIAPTPAPTFTPAPTIGPAFAPPPQPFGVPPAFVPGAQPVLAELPEPVQKKMSTLIRKSQQSRKSKKDLKGDLDSLIEKVRRVQNNKKVQHYKKKLDNCKLEHCSNITNKEDMKNCEKNNCHTELKKYNKRFQKEYTRYTKGIHKQTHPLAFAPPAL